MRSYRRIRVVWLYWFVLLALLTLQGATVIVAEGNEWETEPVLTYPETMDFQPSREANRAEDFLPPGRELTRIPSFSRNGTSTGTLLATQDQAISFTNDKVLIFAEANTFPLAVDLEFTPIETDLTRLDTTRTVEAPRQSQTLYQFQIEAVERDSRNRIGEFSQPVRLIVDIRDLLSDRDLDLTNLTLAYQDENDPSIWHSVPTTLHQADGLLSAEVTHFSNWSVQDAPEMWQPNWQPPGVSSFSGSASYSYPIETPPGRNGLQPNISLSYSSRGLDGLIHSPQRGAIATGWSLTDISIVREGVSFKVENDIPFTKHEDRFRLTLNGTGHEIYPADPNATSSTADMRYYAKDAPGLRIHRIYDSSHNIVDNIYWIVITPDGTHHRLGYREDSVEYQTVSSSYHLNEVGHDGSNDLIAITAWHVDTITDPFGNQMAYEYNQEDDQETISYWYDDIWNHMILTTTKNRIIRINYNFETVVTNLPPTNDVPYPTGLPGSRVEFRSPDDENSSLPKKATDPIKSIYTYHAGNMNNPVAEYRLASEGLIADSLGCDDPLGNPVQTSTFAITSIQQWADTDNDPASNDPGYALPATTFSYDANNDGIDDPIAHYTKNNDPCFRFFYIRGISNGYGGEVSYTYHIDGRSDGNYQINQNSVDWPAMGYNTYVDTLSVIDGLNLSQNTVYTFASPCYNQKPGGNLGSLPGASACAPAASGTWEPSSIGNIVGFGQVTQTLMDFGSTTTPLRETVTTFNQDPATAIGRATFSETRAPGVQPTYGNRTTTTYATYSNIAGVTFTFTSDVLRTQFQGTETLTTRTGYGISNALQGGTQYGNIVTTHDYGDTTITGDEVTVMRKYYPQDSIALNGAIHWVVNKVAHERIFPNIVDPQNFGNGADIRETFYDYDDNGDVTLSPEQGALTSSSAGLWNDTSLTGSTNGLIVTADISYDSYGNVETTAGSSGANETTITYDSTYNLYPVQVENALGYTTTFSIYGYEGVPVGQFGQARRVPGKLRAIIDTNGIPSFFEYDPYGRLFATYESANDLPPNPASSRWGGKEATAYLYWDNSWTDPTLWLDPANDNPFGITQYVHPDTYNPGTTGYLMTSFSFYDGWGRPIQGQEHWLEMEINGQVQQRDSVSTTSYNALGQTDCATVPFDIAHISLPSNPYKANPCTSSAHSTFTYDAMGRQIEAEAPDGTKTNQVYEILTINNVTQFYHDITDSNRHRNQYIYGATGRLENVVEISGNCGNYWGYDCNTAPYTIPWNGYSTTTYDYDLLGSLISVTDEASNTTTLTYDVLGRKTSMNDPDMGEWFYEYDEHSQLIRQTDALGQVICSYYDDLHRLTRVVEDGSPNTVCPSLPVSSGPAHLASYTYDTAPLGTGGATALGLPHTVSWGRYSADNYDTISYDDLGRPDSQTRTLDGVGYTLSTLTYDTLHRPTQMQYPSGEIVSMGYDREGANTLTAGSNALVDDFVFNDRGQPTLLDLGNQVETTYDYYDQNGNFRLERITSQDAGNTYLLRLDYEYDKVGNVTQIEDFQDAGNIRDSQTFTYDHRNRLITADGTGSAFPDYDHAYSYNEIGNITQRLEADPGNGPSNSISYQYADAAHVHAVTSTTLNGQSDTFIYDANGNMIEREDDSGDYDQLFDVQNRLVEVIDNVTNDTTTFTYDASGYRVKTEKPDGTVIYTPYPGYEKEIVPSGGGQGPSNFIWRTTYTFNGQPIATRVTDNVNPANNGLYFLHNDHLGSASVMSTITGSPVADTTARYLPFGDWRTEPTADLTDRGYTSHKHNNMGSDDIGLIYMNARYYVPGIARFASADSIIPNPANPQSYNRYSYVENRPLNFADPTGHIKCDSSLLPGADQNACQGTSGNTNKGADVSKCELLPECDTSTETIVANNKGLFQSNSVHPSLKGMLLAAWGASSQLVVGNLQFINHIDTATGFTLVRSPTELFVPGAPITGPNVKGVGTASNVLGVIAYTLIGLEWTSEYLDIDQAFEAGAINQAQYEFYSSVNNGTASFNITIVSLPIIAQAPLAGAFLGIGQALASGLAIDPGLTAGRLWAIITLGEFTMTDGTTTTGSGLLWETFFPNS